MAAARMQTSQRGKWDMNRRTSIRQTGSLKVSVVEVSTDDLLRRRQRLKGGPIFHLRAPRLEANNISANNELLHSGHLDFSGGQRWRYQPVDYGGSVASSHEQI